MISAGEVTNQELGLETEDISSPANYPIRPSSTKERRFNNCEEPQGLGNTKQGLKKTLNAVLHEGLLCFIKKLTR